MRLKISQPVLSNPGRSRWIQIGWFVAIWIASVLSLGIVVMLIRWAIKPG